MSDEIEYWTQIADIIRPAKSLLEADPIKTYIESATDFVKKIHECVRIMNEQNDTDGVKITPEEFKFVSSFEQFQKQKNRLYKGFKEATWNYKYMSLIKSQVVKIEQCESLAKVSCAVKPLMSSLKNIYESSNFYKEARIISFLDHLYIQIEQNITKTLPKSKQLVLQEDMDEFEDN